ncbi:MAG: glycosyltransferase family 2 protein [Bacteroidaceae bacterium]|nr:glycosyltransferase family 2 protein [Bacteroidaceae bacterium]
MKKVSVLIPCFNEAQTLPALYEELKKLADTQTAYDWELMFVDDGSVDATLDVLKQLHIKDERVCVLSLSRNFGKENALLAGIDNVSGDCVVVMDADLQDPPSLVPEMLTYWEDGYQDVYAKRRDRGREPWIRKMFSLLFYRIMAHATRFELLQNVGDFRLLDRQCIDAMRCLRETERYNKGLFCWIGFKKKEVLFDRGNRSEGESRWSFWSLLNLAIDGITSFTTAPLRFATIIGAIIALGAFCFLVFYISKTLIFGDPVQGFTTLVSVVLFLGGVQLLSIGILGEYIGRIYNEAKGRPNYVVKERSSDW